MKSMHDNILDQVFWVYNEASRLPPYCSSWGYKNERSWESNKMRLLPLPTIWYSYFLCRSADFFHQIVCDHNVNGYTTYVPQVELICLDRELRTALSVWLGKYFEINTICINLSILCCAGGFNEMALLWYADLVWTGLWWSSATR